MFIWVKMQHIAACKCTNLDLGMSVNIDYNSLFKHENP